MACGTSSSIAYPIIKDDYSVYLVSLIVPGAEAALAASRRGRIGVIATAGTINSGSYEKALKSLNKEIVVASQACPLFVPLVEGGLFDSDEARKAAKEYLTPLIKEKIDALVLGCTHYPHLAKVIREVVGPEVALVDPAGAAVAAAKKLLQKEGTLRTGTNPSYEYLTTADPLRFQEIGSRLLGRNIVRATQVDLPLK